MAANTVLITTSGKGNRLGNLTKFTNKALVRIGKKPAISYIIESYPEDTEFVITTGYYGDHVEQFLRIAYPDKQIRTVSVDKFEGVGSSLLYSMAAAKEFLQKTFIFHASDSIVLDKFQDKAGNWCAASRTANAEHYRTHFVYGDELEIIEEKGSSNTNLAHIGIAKIEDFDKFWQEAEKLLNNFPNDQSLSDCHVVNALIENDVGFESKYIENWLDIGNISSLQVARQTIPDKFDILDKDDESIFIFNKKFVVKFFHDQNIVANRVARMPFLREFAPKPLKQEKNFYSYEYIDGIEASKIISESDFSQLCNTMFGYWIIVDETEAFKRKTEQFYFDKTKDRAAKFFSITNSKDTPLMINGSKINRLVDLLKVIPRDWLCSSKKYSYHGDFVLDNIIVKDGNVKFIDWRQDFCGDLDGGDVYYDLAKLNHSLHVNHDVIAKKLFTFQETTTFSGIKDIKVDILRKSSHVDFSKVLYKLASLNGFDVQKIKIISALIWINMSPLHHGEFGKFLYYYGIYHLNKAICELRTM